MSLWWARTATNYFLEYSPVRSKRFRASPLHELCLNGIVDQAGYGYGTLIVLKQEDSVLKYRVLKSRDFIDFHNVLFSSIRKSPELFIFKEAYRLCVKLWRSLWYLMWLPFTRLTLLMIRLLREGSQSQMETCYNVSTSTEGRWNC